MLDLVIQYINLKLSLTDYFQKNYCLTTLVETDGGEVYPAAYISKGNFEKVNLDAFDGTSYIRLREQPTSARNGNRYTPKPRVDITIPLRVVYSIRKSKLTTDDAYSEDRIARSLQKQLESDPLDLVNSLGADAVTVTVSGSSIGKELWDDETANTGKYQPKYDIVYAAIDFDVVATFKQGCIPSECDFDTDILHSFDFCEQAVQARLTAAQIACLEAWLCTCADATVQLNGVTVGTIASGGTQSFTVNLDGVPSGTWDGDSWEVTSAPCADATVQLNGVEMTTIPSGDTENILVLQSNDMTQVGSKQGTHWRIDDSAISINGSSVASVKAEDPLDIDVTQDGSPVGSWNGSAWIIPSCPSAGSLSVAVSNATPDYNTALTITATPSGITPTSYTFLIACQNDGDAYVTQASNVLVWTVNRVGAIKISVTATNGSIEVGATANITVTDPLNYAAKLVDYDMRNNITLVGYTIDIVGDSSGNGHDVTATTSANRAIYDSYSKRYETGGSLKDLRNLASNPLSGVGSFTMFAKFQKQASNATNQRLITFGTSGSGFAVSLFGFAGGDVVVGSNNFSQYTAASVIPQAGTPIAIVKNGTNPYEIYVDGVLATPTGTVGTVPATLPVGNGIYLGTENGSFPLTGSIQRIVTLTGALTATQIAAVNERIKVLHP